MQRLMLVHRVCFVARNIGCLVLACHFEGLVDVQVGNSTLANRTVLRRWLELNTLPGSRHELALAGLIEFLERAQADCLVEDGLMVT